MHARQRSVDGLTVRACLRCSWFDLTLERLLTLFFFFFVLLVSFILIMHADEVIANI